MRIGGHDVVAVATRTVKNIIEDELPEQAAATAYHLVFAVVPLLIFLTALTGYVSAWIGVDDVTDEVTAWIEDRLPAETAEAVIEPIEAVLETQSGGLLSFGVVLALWGAKNAMSALIRGLNVAFNVKDARPWWRQQLLAIGLTIGLGMALIAGSVILLYSALAGDEVADHLGLGNAWATVWPLLEYPLVALFLMVGLAFLYWAGPDVDQPFRLITPGAVLAVLAWIVATYGLGIYFARFAGFTAYGALGAVLVFVFWLFVMSLILLVGGELNATIARSSGTVAVEDASPTEATPDDGPSGAAGAVLARLRSRLRGAKKEPRSGTTG